MTASYGMSGRSSTAQTCAEPHAPREVQRGGGRPAEVHLDPAHLGEQRHQQADRPGSQHQGTFAGVEGGRLQRPPRVAARLHHRPRGVVDRVRKPHQGRDRDDELLGQGPREGTPDADLRARFAHVLSSADTATAVPTAQHRVTGDARTDPGRVRRVAHRRNVAAPLVAEDQGKRGVPSCRYCISPVKNSTSVPHTPTRETSTTAWPGAATGAGEVLQL